MLVLITYDVSTATEAGRARLRKIARLCVDHGQRVQFSVFECLLEPAQWVLLRKALLDIIDPNRDSLRFYFLGANWKRRVEHAGAKTSYDPEGTLLL